MYQVLVDTNILVAALRSRLGVSNFLLTRLGTGKWRLNLTVALFLEYEAVLKRNCREFGLAEEDIDEVLDAICSQAGCHRIYFQWRPAASDPEDEMALEAAIASHSDFIIPYNKRDFAESGRFGIQCHTPKEFLILMEELP